MSVNTVYQVFAILSFVFYLIIIRIFFYALVKFVGKSSIAQCKSIHQTPPSLYKYSPKRQLMNCLTRMGALLKTLFIRKPTTLWPLAQIFTKIPFKTSKTFLQLISSEIFKFNYGVGQLEKTCYKIVLLMTERDDSIYIYSLIA